MTSVRLNMPDISATTLIDSGCVSVSYRDQLLAAFTQRFAVNPINQRYMRNDVATTNFD